MGWMSERLQAYGDSIFATIGKKAIEHRAVNLGQGFPDFDCPESIKVFAQEAMHGGLNQYARPHGVDPLRHELAKFYRQKYGLEFDPDDEVTVQAGSTQAMYSALLATINPGDEVIVFEPTYDTYIPIVQMCGGTAVRVRLHAPDFVFDPDELKKAFNSRTKAIIVNTPHNPTGRVFSRAELKMIADLCQSYDALAITDEVYEHLVFEGEHLPMATFEGMRERTITISSFAKTFSITGWKIGYCLAPPEVTKAIRRIHQFVIFAVATPLQHAAAKAMENWQSLVKPLYDDLAKKRDLLCDGLRDAGFEVQPPQGTFFVLANFKKHSQKADIDYVLELIEGEANVATIPISVFYGENPPLDYIRFCFAKKQITLDQGLAQLSKGGSA